MSERSERLFEALSELDEQKIDEAAPAEGKKRVRWKRWAALAAALAVVIGTGSYFLPRLGGSASNGGGGGAGADGASTFMSYAGPVFPLTLKEADSAITAEREITMGFPEQTDRISTWGMQVTDAYTLINNSEEDKTVSVLYPFAGELRSVEEQQPVLTADGKTLETVLHAGGYSGGFVGAGGPESEGRWNLAQINSWEGYKALLEDGAYRRGALEDYPDLSDVPAIVYEFTDPKGDGSHAATIQAGYELDFTKTMVLSFNFNGGSYDYERGWESSGFFIPEPGTPGDGKPRYLIVLGDDVRNMTTQGYKDGGCDAGEERDFTVTVRRYETSLENILRDVAQEMYTSWWEEPGVEDFEMYFGLMKENLLTYGVLSDYPAERYDTGRLDDLDFNIMDRVFYLEAEVEIPAGGSVALSADLWKRASFNFHCLEENIDVNGYDLVTKLDSNLACTAQTAVLEDNGQIEIVRQNFGFDLENGVNRVTLDPDQEHYYLEVKRLPHE